MHPLFVFPYLRTLRAVFSETMCFYAHPGGMWPSSAQGYIDKEPLVSSTLSAMNFSKVGTTEPAGNGFRAHVQWYDKGANRNMYGPRSPDKQAV